MKDTSRKIYLYDTYRGMPRPTEEDIFTYTGEAAIDMYEKKKNGEYSNWRVCTLKEVKKNMFSTKYPKENLIFTEGKVQDTVPGTFSDSLALLSLDTDWYESTLHELNHFFPLLVNGGVIQIDDYGYLTGQKKAVDEYIRKNNIPILLNRIDHFGRIGIKRVIYK